MFPVAGLLPQHAVDDLRAADFLVAVVAVHGTHVLLDRLPHGPAFGMPEHHARRFVLHVEQVEQLAQFAVVALLRLFQTGQVGIQVFLLRPGRTVDALQHLVLRVAAPVGAGHLHQLERFQLAGRRHVRAAAQVGKFAFAVQRHILVGREWTR